MIAFDCLIIGFPKQTYLCTWSVACCNAHCVVWGGLKKTNIVAEGRGRAYFPEFVLYLAVTVRA